MGGLGVLRLRHLLIGTLSCDVSGQCNADRDSPGDIAPSALSTIDQGMLSKTDPAARRWRG